MWEQVPLPYVCERMIGFSIPDSHELVALSYEGLHRVTLAPSISVSTNEAHAEDYEIYDTERGRLSYGGKEYQMLGLHGGMPLADLPSGERLELDSDLKLIFITDHEGQKLAVIGEFDLTEDWAYATFSMDGAYIAIGNPNDLRLYRRIDIEKR